MEHPHEPIDAITEWQRWYKENRTVELKSINETMTDPNLQTIKEMWRQTIVERFADTIVEAMTDFSGAEIYKCFLEAAQGNLGHSEKEYKNAKQLVDYLTYKQ